MTTEKQRLSEAYAEENAQPWLKWGTYLSERQWGTVREDYSVGGNAWDYFPHEQARSRAYRWGEDGLAGLCDNKQQLCFSLALWNQNDPILKERLFGLTNGEGNHGEDVKEYYYYSDNTPTHSYAKWGYKYPQRAYPYSDLVNENARRNANDPEYELIDTGIFNDHRYFDIQVEYAKSDVADILIKISVTNRGPDTAVLHVLPTLLFRNTWAWKENTQKPTMTGVQAGATGVSSIHAVPSTNGGEPANVDAMKLYCQNAEKLFFVDNETNNRMLWDSQDSPAYPKDGINDHLIHGQSTVNPALTGTKAAAFYRLEVGAGQTTEILLRLSSDINMAEPFSSAFDSLFQQRIAEANAFYQSLPALPSDQDQLDIMRQAYAGMLWGKQYYYYIVSDWLKGDPTQPAPPNSRSRNHRWTHFYANNVLTMPDTWEYPWFAGWDLCFQTVVFSRIDINFAKRQLLILAREWYMSPEGAVPAYEWAFDDVNPPLHAWAALQIYNIEKETTGGEGDKQFLAAIFRYCLMYFTWWTNRKDTDKRNLFEGGFLGLDNISIIDRSNLQGLANSIGRNLELYQSDGTSWMGLFSLNMMDIALKLSNQGMPEFSRLADKFFQHYVYIADALNALEHSCAGQAKLWDDQDKFYYDVLKTSGGGQPDIYQTVRLRSLVGLLTMVPVLSLDFDDLELPLSSRIQHKFQWFMDQHPELLNQSQTTDTNSTNKHLLSFVNPERLKHLLTRMLDENEFLGPYGIRGMSKVHETPYHLNVSGADLSASYEPAESTNGLFGGNSNWRGPVWFPINFILIDSLRTYHEFLGDDFKVEHPTRSGNYLSLKEVADNLSNRLIQTFERDNEGKRPVWGGNTTFQNDPNWKDQILFYEYFQGDNGAGIGASHQTGWTGLVAELLHQLNK